MGMKTTALAVMLLLPTLPATAAVMSYQDLRSIRQACGADIKLLCGNTPRGAGQLAECMRAHAGELSPGCSSVLKAQRAKFPAAAGSNPLYDTD